MKTNKGVTLISLIIALFLIILLTSITVSASVNAYKQMKFDAAKSELEEVKRIVDEIAADYQTYLKEIRGTNKGTAYKDYFAERYNDNSFGDKLLVNHEENARTLLAIHSEINVASATTFYFSSNDLAKYFGLKGVESVVVDFSTRTVYSANGIRNPKNKFFAYFTPADWGGETTVEHGYGGDVSRVVATSKVAQNGSFYDIELVVVPKLDNAIKEIYLYKNNAKYIKINDFREISAEDQTKLRLTIEKYEADAQIYRFMVIDELNNTYQSSADLVIE